LVDFEQLPQASPFGGREGAIHPANYNTPDFLSTLLEGLSTLQIRIEPLFVGQVSHLAYIFGVYKSLTRSSATACKFLVMI
jgi:hypothetical protein